MSSIPIALRQASGKARAKYERDQYMTNLRLRTKLATQTLDNNRTYARMKKLGVPIIQPMKLQEYKSADQLFGDSSAQLKLALENTKKLLPLGDDPATFVQGLDTARLPNGANELQLFNRYFTRFEKNVKETVDVRSITPAFLKQLWNNWTSVIPYFENDAANKGLPIDFRDPAGRVIAQQDLLNRGEILKRRIVSGLTPQQKQGIEDKINDAVLKMDKSVLDDVERQLGAIYGSHSVSVPAPAPVVASAIKAPRKSTTIPRTTQQYTDALIDILEEKIDPATGNAAYQVLYSVLSKTPRTKRLEMIGKLINLANEVFDNIPAASLATNDELQRMIRWTVMLSELAYLDTEGQFDLVKDKKGLRKIADAVKTEATPDDVSFKVRDELGLIPTSGSSMISTGSTTYTGPSVATATPSKSSLTSTIKLTPAKPSGTGVRGLRPRAPAAKAKPITGTGVNKKQQAQIYAGEIAAGNNNPAVKKKLFKLIAGAPTPGPRR